MQERLYKYYFNIYSQNIFQLKIIAFFMLNVLT